MFGRLSARQKQVILSNFLAVTDDVSEKDALMFLQKHGWNLELAMNVYFENPYQLAKSKVSKAKIDALFEKYKDSSETEPLITETGFDEFINDLGISEDDLVQFVFAWECSCERLSIFTPKEFLQGFTRLGCETIEKLKQELPNLRKKIEDPQKFKQFYNWFFMYAKASKEKKGLQKDLAMALWDMVLSDKFMYYEQWKEFLSSYTKDISRDTWQQLLDFARSIEQDPKLENYDETAAWPVLIDEFVEFLKDKGTI